MEVECSPLDWGYCCPEEGLMEELKHSLFYTTLELETTIVSAKEEIARREVEIIRLNDALNRAIKERNDAQTKCQKLMLENLLVRQQSQLQKPKNQKQEAALRSGSASSSEDESKSADSYKRFTSSDSTKNFAALSPGLSDPIIPQQQQQQQQQQQPLLAEAALDELAAEKPLPEKGKLLKAVTEAGPLLQTLLLAGPLPQWQHPPPQLDSIEIPPVAISSSPSPRLLHQDSFNSASALKKRGLELNEASDSSPNAKYQKVVLLH